MKKPGQETDELNLRFMNVKILCFFVFLIGSACCAPFNASSTAAAAAAISKPNNSSEDLTSILRSLKTNVSDVKHEIHNHDTQISKLEGQWQSQEISLEHFKNEITDEVQTLKDLVKASNINTDGKIETLDQTLKNIDAIIKGITTDLKGLKTQANDSVSIINQYKQKLAELETLLQTQSQHMQNLESALQNVLELVQAKNASKAILSTPIPSFIESSSKTYVVQKGDSLGKIACSQHISLQALREANPQITGDTLKIGQTLKLPE